MTPSPSLKRKRTPTRSPSASPSSWSPRTKSAARTIKRIVTKKYTQGKYKWYTRTGYDEIRRAGKTHPAYSTILRRMHMFPVTVTTPLYRGVSPWKNLSYTNIIRQGGFTNRSFTSFSKKRSVALNFTLFQGNSKPYVLVLPPGTYPAINRTVFVGNKRESEVTLAPGVYTVNGLTNKGNIRVTYKPLNRSPRKD